MVHLQESAPVRRNICYICRKVHQSGTFGTSVGKCIRQENLVHLQESASAGGTFGTSVGKCISQEYLVHLQESASVRRNIWYICRKVHQSGGTYGTSVGKCISQEHLVHLQESASVRNIWYICRKMPTKCWTIQKYLRQRQKDKISQQIKCQEGKPRKKPVQCGYSQQSQTMKKTSSTR